MTLRFAGPNNGYIAQATGQVVGFIRKPSEFKLNAYAQLVKSPAPTGLYSVLGRDESVRVVSDAEFSWEDGADMPTGDLYKSRFEAIEFRCKRRAYPWSVGKVSEENSTLWKPKLSQMAEAISMAMTNRTAKVISMMETTGNWGANTAKVVDVNGGRGFWDKASDLPDSPNFNAISVTILEGARRVNLYTNGVVKISDLKLVLSPGAATKMARSAEISHYVANSPVAREWMERPGGDVNKLWGLPSHYQGVEIVVEDASRVTERASATASSTSGQASNPGNRNYIKSDNSAVLCSRPGGLDGTYGEQSFSTVQVYYYDELLRVKAEYDSWNEKYKGAVVEYFKEVLAAPPAGFLFTNLFS